MLIFVHFKWGSVFIVYNLYIWGVEFVCLKHRISRAKFV